MNPLMKLASLTDPNHPPEVFKSAFKDDFLNEMEILNFFRSLKSIDLKENVICRVYVSGREDPQKVYELLSSSPSESDNLETWTQRIFGSLDFLIVINRAEYLLIRFAEKLYQRYGQYLRPDLIEDSIFKGIDLVLFIGRYAESPLGPHHDVDKLSITHFQVLGKKQFKFWSSSQCERDPDQLVVVARGDAISFGGLNYHSAQATVLSASLSIGLTRFSAKGLIKEAHETLTESFEREIFSLGTKNMYPDMSQVNTVLKLSEFQNSVASTFQQSFDTYALKKRSGLLYITPPKLSDVPAADLLKQKKISLRKPNRIFYRKDGPSLHIYLRRYHFKIHSTAALEKLLLSLNTHEVVQISDHLGIETFVALGLMLRVDVWNFQS